MAFRLMINDKEIEFCDKKNYSLEILDTFTSQFENSEELKIYLVENDIIKFRDFYDELYILNKYDNNIKTPIIYKKFEQYLDKKVLIKYFSDRTNDKKLLSKLIYAFKGDKQNKIHIPCIKIYHYIYDSANYDFIDIDESLEELIRQLITNACENHSNKRKIANIIISDIIKKEKINNDEKLKYYQDRLSHIKHLLSFNVENTNYENLIKEAEELEKLLNTVNPSTIQEVEEQIIIEELGEDYGESSRH